MSLGDDYESAIRGGRTDEANYLAQMLASAAGININSNKVTAAPASMLPNSNGYGSGPSASLSIPEGYFSGGAGPSSNAPTYDPSTWSFSNILGPILQGFTNPLGTAKSVGSSSEQDTQNAAALAKSDTIGGVGRLLAIVTDIPRMITLILGVALILIGLLMLNNRTIVAAVQAVRT